MKEVRAILRACSDLPDGEPAVLATVVRVAGSAYRRPGARMLLLPDGRTVGTVSGGCLEGDLKLRSWRLTEGARPAVVRYDSTSEGEMVWQLGLGCKGVVDVLLERIDRATRPLHFLRRCLDARRAGALARVVAVERRAGADVGAYLTLDEAGRCDHDVTGAELAGLLRRAAGAALGEGRSRYVCCELSAGRAEVFVETVRPSLPLLVCGAGHDAIPLVRLASELGWHVTVIDPRPSYATRERFPLADAVIVALPEVGNNRPTLPLLAPGPDPLPPVSCEAAVIMSHNYHNDLQFLRALLPSPPRYLGVLGPKSRTESLLRDLAAGGFTPTAGQTARLYGPVGLDLGADTPEEIALAVVAEIQAVLAGRSGASLRERDRPIHDRAKSEGRVLGAGRERGERVCLAEGG